MLYLSQLLGAPVEDPQGERIGKIIDVEVTRSISNLCGVYIYSYYAD